MSRYGSLTARVVRWREVRAQLDFAEEQVAELKARHPASYAWAVSACRAVLQFIPNEYSHQREVAYILAALPFNGDVDGMLARLIACEVAIRFRPPSWERTDAEALNRGRLFVSGCRFGQRVHEVTRRARRLLGELLMSAGLPVFCEKLLAKRDERAEQRRAELGEALRSLDEPAGAT